MRSLRARSHFSVCRTVLRRCLHTEAPITAWSQPKPSALASRCSDKDVVIAGAGLAGILTAHALKTYAPELSIAILDDMSPLSLTSSVSSECYRNAWASHPMVSLSNLSIDLMDQLARDTDNAFNLNRNGYVFLSRSSPTPAQIDRLEEQFAKTGVGELRVHEGSAGLAAYRPTPRQLDTSLAGVDLILGERLVNEAFPFVAKGGAGCALHIRRAGWLSAHSFGMVVVDMLKGADAPVEFIRGRLVGVDAKDGYVRGVRYEGGLATEGGGAGEADSGGASVIGTKTFINCTGPWINGVNRLMGLPALPVFNELHAKVVMEDRLGIIPKQCPLVIWKDPIDLHLSDEERDLLGELELEYRDDGDMAAGPFGADVCRPSLLRTLPGGLHFRPAGGNWLLLLWECVHIERSVAEPAPAEPSFDPLYPEYVIRGVSTFVDRFDEYLLAGNRYVIDGGYYCRTTSNLPLIGPYGPRGAFVVGGLGGFGVMTSAAAGELLARHVLGGPRHVHVPPLPDFSHAFDPSQVASEDDWKI